MSFSPRLVVNMIKKSAHDHHYFIHQLFGHSTANDGTRKSPHRNILIINSASSGPTGRAPENAVFTNDILTIASIRLNIYRRTLTGLRGPKVRGPNSWLGSSGAPCRPSHRFPFTIYWDRKIKNTAYYLWPSAKIQLWATMTYARRVHNGGYINLRWWSRILDPSCRTETNLKSVR